MLGRDKAEIDIHPLSKAITLLAEALARHAQTPDNDLLRDGCIQRFEFTYELSHKMLKRFLEATSANPAEFDAMSFPDLIRSGSERGLLRSDWSHWKDYRKARSISSHTCDEYKAREVFAMIPDFLDEAEHLYRRLEAGIAA
jgi:nucleotidyltransferase substrate binding protein (TIGR01987 family)